MAEAAPTHLDRLSHAAASPGCGCRGASSNCAPLSLLSCRMGRLCCSWHVNKVMQEWRSCCWTGVPRWMQQTRQGGRAVCCVRHIHLYITAPNCLCLSLSPCLALACDVLLCCRCLPQLQQRAAAACRCMACMAAVWRVLWLVQQWVDGSVRVGWVGARVLCC